MSNATVTPIDRDRLRDPRTEAWLDERHVTFTFEPALSIERIDRAASLTNQARLEALDDEVVERYAADIDRGDVFPPVLAQARGKRKLLLLGGNHRLAAHTRLKRPTIAAYVLEVADEMATRLMYEDNRRHGLPPSEAERIRQAIHLIDCGYTQEAAAEVVGVAAPKISIERSVVRSDRRAGDLKLPVHRYTALARQHRYQLGLIKSDPVFEAAARLVLDAQLTGDATRKLVVRLRDARSDAAALDIVAAETEHHRAAIQAGAAGSIKHTRTPRGQLVHAISIIRSLKPADVYASCSGADQRRELAQYATDAGEELKAIVASLKGRK